MEVIYDGKVVHEFVDISLASNFKSGDGVQTVKVQPSAVDQLKKLSIDYLHKVVSIRINANQPVNVIISSVIDSGLFVIHLADGKNNNEKPKVFNSKEEATQDLLDTFVPGPKGGN